MQNFVHAWQVGGGGRWREEARICSFNIFQKVETQRLITMLKRKRTGELKKKKKVKNKTEPESLRRVKL